MTTTTTKLDDILTTLGSQIIVLEDDLIEPTEKVAKQHIKRLILETFGDALIESKSVEEMGDKFRKKILAL